MKLSTKILLPSLSMILLGLVIVAGSNFFVARNALENNLHEQLSGNAGTLAEASSNWVNVERKREMVGWSKQDVYVRSLEDSFIGRSSRKAASSTLAALLNEYGHYSDLLLADMSGQVVAASDADLVQKLSLADKDYFSAVRTGEVTISAPQTDQNGNPILVVAAPIAKDGQNSGLLAGVIDLNAFAANNVANISIGQNGYACLVTGDGYIIAGREMGQFLSGKECDFSDQQLASSGILSYDKDGHDRKLAYQNVSQLGWVALASADLDELMAPVHTLGKTSATITVIILALAAGVMWYTARFVTQPVKKALQFADSVAEGDLSLRLAMSGQDEVAELGKSLDRMADNLAVKVELAQAIADGDLTRDVVISSEKDALGNALHGMSESLNKMINQVTFTAERVQEGSQQISESSNALSNGATEQAASLEEISASMTEIKSQVEANANHATEANQLVNTAREDTTVGYEKMSVMTQAMSDISDSSTKIGSIIGVIEDIAFQTNLLALNAAVEAARAGRHGKGFAVVAEEVRQLASRCAKAAGETSELIGGSVQYVSNGTTVAEETSEALKKIVDGIAKSADLIGEIADASREQAVGITQVSEGIAQIDTVTQQNTASAEETASATTDLSEQANGLHQLLQSFTVKQQMDVVDSVEPVEQDWETYAEQNDLMPV